MHIWIVQRHTHHITLADHKESIAEQEADAFAKNTLIRPREWQIFKTKVKGINPAIVLGRYQHEFNVYDNGRGFDRSIK